MKFEFDPNKSLVNKAKHGIDFVEGQAVWADADRIIDIPEQVKAGEAYWKAVGQAMGALWAMIYNRRGDAIRIVSIRRAREDEKEEYEILKG